MRISTCWVAAVAPIMLALSVSAFSAVPKPTIVLVHGAFADSSSWDGVTKLLHKDGYTVIGAANPLRGVKNDAAYVSELINAIKGPVVLVGHSYGGTVITNAALGHENVKSLVYVAAFAPDQGETSIDLASKFPGSTLGPTLSPPVPLQDGSNDLYIQSSKFQAQFAADVPEEQAALMAAGQRPIKDSALSEPSGIPAWKTIPSWFIYGGKDKNIPVAAFDWMANRVHSISNTVVKGASHVVMVTHPEAVTKIIEQAAK
ncbi:alpha/beta fold hydrolase [Pseudomonas sp. SDO528_S397]